MAKGPFPIGDRNQVKHGLHVEFDNGFFNLYWGQNFAINVTAAEIEDLYQFMKRGGKLPLKEMPPAKKKALLAKWAKELGVKL